MPDPDASSPGGALVPLEDKIAALEQSDRALGRARRHWSAVLLTLAAAAVALPAPWLQGAAFALGCTLFLAMRAALGPRRAARRTAYEDLRRAYVLASRAEDHGRTLPSSSLDDLERARRALGPGRSDDG